MNAPAVTWTTFRGHGCEGPCGAILTYADGCDGSISWCSTCPGPTWELHALEPLHVEPSIRCTHRHVDNPHQHHGWIRAGVWEPAGDDLTPV